jgi:hypothetical protein
MDTVLNIFKYYELAKQVYNNYEAIIDGAKITVDLLSSCYNHYVSYCKCLVCEYKRTQKEKPPH